MGKKKSKITYIQKRQREENKLKIEQEIKEKEFKEKFMQERKAKFKRGLKRAFVIFICSIFCFMIIGTVGFFVYKRVSAKNRLFWAGLVAVEQNKDKWGYINSSGKVVIDFKFDHAYNFTKNKLALVGVDEKFGYINTKGEFEIDPIYTNAIPFDGNVAICKLNGYYGTINEEGKELAKFEYTNISPFTGKYAIAIKSGKYGIIDRLGNVVIDFTYEKIEAVNDTYFKYVDGTATLLGFVDKEKTTDSFFTDKFQSLNILENGYCIFRREGKSGLLGPDKSIVLEAKFTDLEYESGQYLKYSTTGDFFGYIDFNGEIFIREMFLYASSFDDYGIVKYTGDEKYYVINDKGRQTYSLKCDMLSPFYQKRAVFEQSDLYGVISPNGTVMFDAKYKFISNFYDDGYAIYTTSNDLYGIMRVDGKIKVEAKYTNIASN